MSLRGDAGHSPQDGAFRDLIEKECTHIIPLPRKRQLWLRSPFMRIYCAMFVWLLAGSAFSQAKMPAISFDSVSKDAGRVTQGEVVRQVFTFINKGTGILEIKGVEPS